VPFTEPVEEERQLKKQGNHEKQIFNFNSFI
jgi:hypothetical protein